MAGDRGRDLKFSILSDTSKFDLEGPADDMADLSDSSKDATDELKRLAAQGKDAQKQLDALNRETKDNEFDTYGKDAHDAARKVDDAFDDIAKSAKSNMRTVEKSADDGFKEVGHATAEVKDEAKANLSEVTSSFQGDMTSAVDVIQGTLGGLVASLGPAGAAIAGAGALAVGTIAKLWQDSKDKAEANKQATKELFDALVEGQGRLQAASLQSRLEDLIGDPDQFKELKKQADAAGVSVTTYARAVAGSIPDQQRINDQLKAARDRLDATSDANTRSRVAADAHRASLDKQRDALKAVSDRLGITSASLNDAHDAWTTLDQATREGITADVKVRTPTAKELYNERAELQRGIGGRPLTIPTTVAPPPATASWSAAQVAKRQMESYFHVHPVWVSMVGKPAQTPAPFRKN